MREENKEMREEKRDVTIEQLRDEEFDDLFKLTMENKWKQVVQIYSKLPRAHITKLTKSEETALHIAISTYHSKRPDHAIYVEQMIDLMEAKGSLAKVLSMQNVRGDTPLHLAAAVGCESICERIALKSWELISIRNVRGETPLFVAAHHGNLRAFLCLHERYKVHKKDQQPEPQQAELDESLHRTKDQHAEPLCRKKEGATSELELEIEDEHAEPDESLCGKKKGATSDIDLKIADQQAEPDESLCGKKKEATSDLDLKIADQQAEPDGSLGRRKDGNTILHSAISGEYFRLAYQIIRYYPTLINSVNVNGESPLHVLVRKPNVFKSSSYLRFYDSIIYHCVFVDELKEQKYDSRDSQNRHFAKSNIKNSLPGNYRTCVDILFLLCTSILTITGGFRSCNRETGISADEENQEHSEKKLPASSADEENQEHSEKKLPASKSLPTQEQSTKANPTEGQAEKSTAADKKEKRNNGAFFPANYTTCMLLFKFAMKIILTVLGVGYEKIKKIQAKKERYFHALVIMNQMIEHEPSYKYDSNGQRPEKNLKPEISEGMDIPDTPPQIEEHDAHHNTETNIGTTSVPQVEHDAHHNTETNIGTTSPTKAHRKNENQKDQNKSEEKTPEPGGLVKKDTPLLVAAKMGILEMVKKIISKCPVAIQDQDSKGKNVLMLAAEHRQTNVFDYLIEINLPEYMFHQLDDEENSILNLAAKLGKELQPWRIPGAALQMQWEIKWYKHVKRSLSPFSLSHHNKEGDTPRTILTRTHQELKKAGNEWLIKTSESCSVVAALIAAVAFATSATVPGGLNQEKGYPILKDEKAFDVFSIASLVALCLSVTALVFFLAIITSRCEERDFKTNLPRKLLMGLSSLFASIIAMLLSFCAGHSFILREKLRIAAVPIYAFATIPVAFFAVAQLPLYFDLLWATCRKVPLRSYKVFCQ